MGELELGVMGLDEIDDCECWDYGLRD